MIVPIGDKKENRETWKGSSTYAGKVLEKGHFRLSGLEKGKRPALFQALGAKYHDNTVVLGQFEQNYGPRFPLGNCLSPGHGGNMYPADFVRQNHLVFGKCWRHRIQITAPGRRHPPLFLPWFSKRLYEKMDPVYQKQYLKMLPWVPMWKYAERMQYPIWKNRQRIHCIFFNAKGVLFTRTENGSKSDPSIRDKGTSCHAV